MKLKEQEKLQASSELPPFLAMAAVYRHSLRVRTGLLVVVIVLAAAIVGMQEVRFHGALRKVTDRDILIVPGAVDFMRVRPNVLPDTAVYYFAEYIAEHVGSFNFQNIEDRTQRLSEFLTPQFREQYLAEIHRNLRSYRELQVAEVFTPAPVTKFDLVKDAGGYPHYVVPVTGQLDRYSGDTRLLSEPEVITLTFRTTPVRPDKPWFFEVESITRKSREEYTREQQARERLTKK